MLLSVLIQTSMSDDKAVISVKMLGFLLIMILIKPSLMRANSEEETASVSKSLPENNTVKNNSPFLKERPKPALYQLLLIEFL